MPSNYVEIAIKARDDAKPPLDDLRLALDELNRRVAEALATVDDKEAEATLLRLNAKLDEIGRKVENPRLTVAGADKAIADLAAADLALDKVGGEAGAAAAKVDGLKLSLDELNRKVATALAEVDDDEARAKLLALGVKLDDIGRKVASPRISVAGADRAVAELAAVDVALNKVGSSGAGAAASAVPALSSLNFATVGLGAAVAAAVPVVIGASTSIAAMGAAGALAYPDIKQVIDILNGTSTGPSSGPIAQAVTEIRDLEAAYKQVSASSGIGQNLISDALPKTIEAVENVLGDLAPLAKAGATSIDEIASAVDRVTGSSGFKSFLGDLAQQAPADTDAILNLAGAVGGGLSQAFESAGPHVATTIDEIANLVSELSGPFATAVGFTTQAIGGISGALSGAVGFMKAAGDDISGVFDTFTSKTREINGQDVGKGPDAFAAGLRAIHQPDVLTFLGALTGNSKLTEEGMLGTAQAAKKAATSIAQAGTESHSTSSATSEFAQEMATAASGAGTLTSRVSALTTALSSEGDATAGALGSMATFHQQLLTTETAMAASGNKAGYLTKQSQAAAAAFATLYGDAKSASGAILQTGGTASQAAGPLIAMRDEMEKIQDPTAAERELLRELNAEIAALHSKTIQIGVQVIEEGSGGQPVPVSGGPGGRIQGGPAGQVTRPQAMVPGAMVPGAVNPALLPPPGGTGESPAYAAMRKYMEGVRASVLQDATLGNIQQAAGSHKIGGKAYLTGMQNYLQTIRKFDEAIKKLAHEGLDRQLLAQIIQVFQSDPESGLQIAEALLNGPISRIYNLNKTERAIERAAKNVGQASSRTQFSVGGLGKHHIGSQGGFDFTLTLGSSDRFMRALFDAMRVEVKRVGGGGPDSVQRTFGLRS